MRLFSGALVLLVLCGALSAGARRLRKRSANSASGEQLTLPDSALQGLSTAGTRRLQMLYVSAYEEVKAAQEQVADLVQPCKDQVAALSAQVRQHCLPCVKGHCQQRALTCQIESTPASPPSCDALKGAADKAAIARLCSHYLRTCPAQADVNATIACARDRCMSKIESCNPCNDGFLNSAVCEVAGFGLDVKDFFTDDIPDFFTEDVSDFFTEDVSDFFTEDVSDFFTEDVADFFTDTIGEGFLDFTDDVGDFFGGAFDTTGDFFSDAFDSTTDFFGEGFDVLGGFGEDIGDFFTDDFTDFFTDDVGGFFDDVGDGLGDIGSDIGQGFEDFGDTLGDIFGKRRRRRRSVSEVSCAVLTEQGEAAGEARSRACISSYVSRCPHSACRHVSQSGGVNLATVCPEMTAKNNTYVALKETHIWILGIPKDEVKMTFTSFVVDKGSEDAGSLYAAVARARVRDTTFTFTTRVGLTRDTFRESLPAVVEAAVAAYRGAGDV